MEATGIYWKPIFHALSAAERPLEVLLVNARHVKNVPGRKSDALDAAWLAELTECGLMRGSFIPHPRSPRSASSPDAPAVVEKAYTGRSAGDEVTVAVAVKDGKAVAYVCDGENVEAWLEGTLTGETLALSGKTDTVTGTVDDNAAFGTVVVDGAEWPFSARGVAAPAGLYEGRGSLRGVAARVGWIVEDDGTVTGVLTAGGESSRAPTLDPDAPDATTLEGRPVAVTALAGDATVVRR